MTESDEEFDAVVNWFTSFGYFDPQTNDRVLARFARALRPGGRLLLELHNPWRLQRLLAPPEARRRTWSTSDGDVIADRVTYDARHTPCRAPSASSCATATCAELEFTLEQVPAPDLANRLRRAGFARCELFAATAGARSRPAAGG